MVKINNFISFELTIKCGVSQGTTLSPVLFNYLYKRHKITSFKKSRNMVYIDIALIFIANTCNEVFKNIGTDIKNY